MILHIYTDLKSHGEAYFLKQTEINKVKMVWLSKEPKVQADKLSKKYINFVVQEEISSDHDKVYLHKTKRTVQIFSRIF